jgi:hypothetical protein
LNQTTSNFLIRLLNWEFWPWPVVYFPVMIYYCWLSLKARTPFFFFATNPGIESGGLLIESKKDILDMIPGKLKPKTLFFKYPSSLEEILAEMHESGIYFPVIAKPDYGERGWMVEKIEDTEELRKYVNQLRINLIVQEYVDLPVELGILYFRIPGEKRGHVSSVTAKILLHVTGDGSSTVGMLIRQNPRARLHLKEIEKRHQGFMNYVPARNEKVELVPIGNHSRGTAFIDRNDLIDDRLETTIDNIAHKLPGFYYGRFDLRCSDLESMKQGKNIRILELNGCKSEPAHIYHPGGSLIEAYRVLFFHWKTLYRIAIMNNKNGYRFPSFSEGWKSFQKYRYFRKMRKER